MTDQRRIDGKRLVVATHNNGKLREFYFLLGGLSIDLVSAGDLGLPVPVEDGETFVDNARIKALAAARAAGEVALADDSGLCVEALDGRPGVHTADWAGPNRDWSMAMRLVEEELYKAGAATPDRRRATFVSLLCLAWPDGHTEDFEAIVEGTLVWPPRGDTGFGYDPVFLPEGETRSAAQMTAEEKDAVSHRRRAFTELSKELLRRLP